jgi:hypothetical protein
MIDWVTRVLMVTLGAACIGLEMWGSYEFMWAKYHAWNYLVAASLMVPLIGGALPAVATSSEDWKLKVAAWLATPLALLFIFTVAIERTGSAVDAGEAQRQQNAEAIRIARQEEAEAVEQLKTDKAMVKSNCDIVGPICKQMKAAQEKTQGKLDAAREVLRENGVETSDSMAKRLAAYLPFLTEERVRLYQPVLLPLILAITGPIFLAAGFARRKRRPELAVASVLRPEPVAEVETEPEPVPIAPPRRPKPRLIASADTPVGSVLEIVPTVIERGPGRMEFADVFLAYARECKALGKTPAQPEAFAPLLQRLCRELRIKTTKTENGSVYLLGVQPKQKEKNVADA